MYFLTNQVVNTVYPNSIRKIIDEQTVARVDIRRKKKKNVIQCADEFEDMITEDIFGLGNKIEFICLIVLKEVEVGLWLCLRKKQN